jgi:hypothetical protein
MCFLMESKAGRRSGEELTADISFPKYREHAVFAPRMMSS